jgi:hypothetical protein
MSDLLDFVPDIVAKASGCPDSVVIDGARKAIIRLCEDSLIYSDDIIPGDIVTGVDDYTITPPVSTRVVTVLSLYQNKRELRGYTEQELDYYDYNWRNANPGIATGWTLLAPDRIKLNRVPEKDLSGGIVVKAALKPSESAVVVDNMFYNDWRQAVTDGALSLILAIPKKPWTNKAEANERGKAFIFQVQRARERYWHGFQRKSITAKIINWV